jgi:hypothetical protein
MTGIGDILKPHEVPRTGERRLVRFLPTPMGSRPALWISPYYTMEIFQTGCPAERAKKCIVLLNPGSDTEKPDTAVITIPADAIEKFPWIPVEW